MILPLPSPSALLFQDVVQEQGRQGAIKYPLVGWWGIEGIEQPDPEEPASIGINSLRWADQHVHHVAEYDPTWYFGSDMARFHIKEDRASLGAWGVAVDLSDLKKPRCWITYMLIVDASKQDPVERAVRNASSEAGFDLRLLIQTLLDSVFEGRELSASCRDSLGTLMRALPGGQAEEAGEPGEE